MFLVSFLLASVFVTNLDACTIWQSDRSGNKERRLLIDEGLCLQSTSVLRCILGKL